MAPGDGKGNLEEHFDDGDEDGGHDAHDADGKPADGPFDGTEFHGAGGSQPVGGGTEGKPAGDAALDAQAFQDKRSDGAAENTDHDDHHRRNGRDAAGTLGNAHGDGGGDGFGFEGGDEGMVRPEITGNEDDAEDAGEATDKNGGDDGKGVRLEVFQLLVEQVAEDNDRGSQHEGDDAAAPFEGFVGDAEVMGDHRQHGNGDEEGVEEGEFRLAVKPYRREIDADDEGEDEDFGVQKRLHVRVILNGVFQTIAGGRRRRQSR